MGSLPALSVQTAHISVGQTSHPSYLATLVLHLAEKAKPDQGLTLSFERNLGIIALLM